MSLSVNKLVNSGVNQTVQVSEGGVVGTIDLIDTNNPTAAYTANSEENAETIVTVTINSAGTLSVTTDGEIELDALGINGSAYVSPLAAAPGTYEVMVSIFSNSGPATTTGTFATWLALTSSRTFTFSVDTATGSSNTSIDIAIRDNGGPTLDTERYLLDIRNEA